MAENLKLNNTTIAENTNSDLENAILDRLDGKLAFRLTNAYLFVAVLQKDHEALCSLIAALLHKKREEIVSVEIMNPIVLGQEIDLKTCILDLLVILNNNIRINIEMQVNNENNWDDRSVYYLGRKLPDLHSGRSYEELKPFHQIGILAFNYPVDNKEFYQEICLMNIKTHRIYSDKVSIHVLCLPMIENATEEDRASGLYFWAKVFQATTWKELKKMAENTPAFKKTIVTMAELTEDEKIRQMCLAREQYDRDMLSNRIGGYKEGYSKGKIEICVGLIRDGLLSEEEAAERLGISVEKLKNYL